MRTPAGQFTQQVTFERAATSRGALGGMNPGVWSGFGTRAAKMLWGTGSERRAAAVEGAVQAATFRCRLDSVTDAVTMTDRILHVGSGLRFDITGIAPIEADGEIEFTGTTSRG